MKGARLASWCVAWAHIANHAQPVQNDQLPCLSELPTFLNCRSMQEALLESPSAYKCFNDFFYRKLKPEARPIALPTDSSVVVSAADCR